jgi:hypothetical protein
MAALRAAFADDGDDCGSGWSGVANCFQRVGHVARFTVNLPRTALAVGAAELSPNGGCDMAPGLMVVCSEVPEWMDGPGGGGFTLGNTYLNADSEECALNYLPHENTHATQWAMFDWGFPGMYVFDWAVHGGEQDGMWTEDWAGLAGGGYGVPPFPGC